MVLPLLLAALPAEAGRRRPAVPSVTITAPAHGSFSNATQVTVTGQVQNVILAQAQVTVNGVGVAVDGSGSFTATVPLDANAIWNPIEAQLTVLPSGLVKRDRVVVVAGESIADGAPSPESIAMRINDGGLDQVEPQVESLVNLDVAALLPVGSVVFDDCLNDTIFGCAGGATATVTNPPPSISGFSIDMDSMPGAVAGDIAIQDLDTRIHLDGWGTLFFVSCDLRITAAATQILGDYDLGPNPSVPTQVDVDQLGGVSVTFGSFQSQFLSGVCDFPLIGDVIQAIIGDIQPTVRSGLESFLDDPDGPGPADGPIADAIETALAGIEISGPIGTSLGITLQNPIFDILEDATGLTFDTDTIATASVGTAPGQCPAPPDAPDLPGSYHVTEAFPTLTELTPGGLPYDLGICISTSAFNQLLKAQIECGLLQTDITEFDFGTGLLPITAGLLGLFVPEFQALPPDHPMVIRLRPSLAPLLTGAPGPNGELVELRIGDLRAQVLDTGPSPTVWIEVAVDARSGLDLLYDDVTGALSFALGPLTAADLDVALVSNQIQTNEAALLAVLPQVLTFALPGVADSLGAFPLPSFLGLGLTGVEVGRAGEFLSLYLDFVPAP